MTYGIQIWGCTGENNRSVIQRCQNKILRGIVDATWYVRNDNPYRDLNVETVNEVMRKQARNHEQRLQQHPNPEVSQLLDTTNVIRRLKRTKPLDLV